MQLLERQEQLEKLERCLQEARVGSGKLVLVAGEAGIGKSSLVDQFASVHRRDSFTLWGACDALTTPRALGPVHEIAAQTSVSDGHSPGTDESRDWLFRGLLEEFSRPERTCVVVLEDLHWADEATLDFFRFIGRRIQRTSTLFIATYRDDELPLHHPVRLALGELTGHHVQRMRLAPLTVAAVGDLAGKSDIDVARLHQLTGGNPFFVHEVLASPGERVPVTVRDAVLSRLLRCSAPARELAELVSMSPGKTERWLIQGVIGDRGLAIDEGVSRGLFAAQTDAIGFRHELARLAVQGTVTPERARAMHEGLLQALVERRADLTRIVHHAAGADNAAAVLEYAPLAGKEAARLGAHREAAAHLGVALRFGATLPAANRGELLELRAEECSVTNQAIEAIASANEALLLWRELGNIEAQARVLSFLSPEYRVVGDKQQAEDSVVAAIALLEPLPPSVHLAWAYSTRSRLASHYGLDTEAVEFGRRALALARTFGDHATESHALNNVGSALLIAGDRTGFEQLERSLTIALEHQLEEGAARAYGNFVFCSTLEHDLLRAERYYREGVAYCEERGLFSSLAYLHAYGARLALDRGDWTEAARIATGLLQGMELVPLQRVPTLVTLALVRIRRGDPGADELLDEAFELALLMGEPERLGRVASARAEQAWYRGDLERLASETATGLGYLGDKRFPAIKGELAAWQSRARAEGPVPQDIQKPYRLALAGDWRGAAGYWESIGAPYEQALAMIEGPEEALRQALAVLDRLGAGPLAAIVRRRLREQGVRAIPRGPNETTRANAGGLTAREIEVLALLAQGSTNAQLARQLHRSTKTIDRHVSAILEKLGVHSRTQAVVAAQALGILKPRDDAPPGRS
ncbi:MAG TPA: AAA family ATPase [Steroidobacteraceae bacterium]|nr:AAA family ATPase [Steroidobacteraceae bacterium]